MESKSTSDQTRVRSANSSSRNAKSKPSSESKGTKKKAVNIRQPFPNALEPIPEAPSNPASTAGSSLTIATEEVKRLQSDLPTTSYSGGTNHQRKQWQVQSSSTLPVSAEEEIVRNEPQVQGTSDIERAQEEVVWELDASRYKIGKVIGSGSYATVYLADEVDSLGVSKKVVVKKLDRAGRDYEAMNEVDVMKQAGRHPNLVLFKGFYFDPDAILCLVMGFADGGSLSRLIQEGGVPVPTALASPGRPGSSSMADDEALFPEDLVMAWFCQLLLALHHLHSKHIVHRDIKPDNILLSRNRRVIMLGDLGVAKQLEGTLEYTISCLGTPYYMSPEVIASRPYHYASDIWSLGCVLHEMAARKTAFQSIGLPQLMYKIIKTDFSPLPHGRFSKPLQLLVNSMLRSDPVDRPTTRDLILMPFVKKHLGLLLGPAAVRAVVESATAEASSSYDNLPLASQADLLNTAMRGLKKEGLGGGSKKKVPSGLKKPPKTSKAPTALVPDNSPLPRASSSALNLAPLLTTLTRKTPTPPSGASRAISQSTNRASSVSQAAVPVAAVKSAKKIDDWVSGALWERKVAKQAEARIKARQYDARLTREQARQARKEKDPEHKAREAELAAIGEHLMEKRRREVEGQRMARSTWLDIGEDVGGGGWGGYGEGINGFFDEFGAWHEGGGQGGEAWPLQGARIGDGGTLVMRPLPLMASALDPDLTTRDSGQEVHAQPSGFMIADDGGMLQKSTHETDEGTDQEPDDPDMDQEPPFCLEAAPNAMEMLEDSFEAEDSHAEMMVRMGSVVFDVNENGDGAFEMMPSEESAPPDQRVSHSPSSALSHTLADQRVSDRGDDVLMGSIRPIPLAVEQTIEDPERVASAEGTLEGVLVKRQEQIDPEASSSEEESDGEEDTEEEEDNEVSTDDEDDESSEEEEEEEEEETSDGDDEFYSEDEEEEDELGDQSLISMQDDMAEQDRESLQRLEEGWDVLDDERRREMLVEIWREAVDDRKASGGGYGRPPRHQGFTLRSSLPSLAIVSSSHLVQEQHHDIEASSPSRALLTHSSSFGHRTSGSPGSQRMLLPPLPFTGSPANLERSSSLLLPRIRAPSPSALLAQRDLLNLEGQGGSGRSVSSSGVASPAHVSLNIGSPSRPQATWQRPSSADASSLAMEVLSLQRPSSSSASPLPPVREEVLSRFSKLSLGSTSIARGEAHSSAAAGEEFEPASAAADQARMQLDVMNQIALFKKQRGL